MLKEFVNRISAMLFLETVVKSVLLVPFISEISFLAPEFVGTTVENIHSDFLQFIDRQIVDIITIFEVCFLLNATLGRFVFDIVMMSLPSNKS